MKRFIEKNKIYLMGCLSLLFCPLIFYLNYRIPFHSQITYLRVSNHYTGVIHILLSDDQKPPHTQVLGDIKPDTIDEFGMPVDQEIYDITFLGPKRELVKQIRVSHLQLSSQRKYHHVLRGGYYGWDVEVK